MHSFLLTFKFFYPWLEISKIRQIGQFSCRGGYNVEITFSEVIDS